MRRIRLGVNVDHVAQVRQARGTKYPDPIFAAFLAEQGGADQITVHLREDRRHIQERDLEILRKTVQTDLNLEMACVKEIVDIACRVRPDMCTLVPERRQELTTERGIGAKEVAEMRDTIARLKQEGIRVSIFLDPEPEAVEAAVEVGADQIELHTGYYSEAKDQERREKELDRLRRAAAVGGSAGIAVAAGHGLDYVNTRAICSIPQVEELNIGHSIVARAIFVGMEEAVRQMVELIRTAVAESAK